MEYLVRVSCQVHFCSVRVDGSHIFEVRGQKPKAGATANGYSALTHRGDTFQILRPFEIRISSPCSLGIAGTAVFLFIACVRFFPAPHLHSFLLIFFLPTVFVFFK